ncbi:MAG TPA: AAA family ATPase [Chloroflexota bacterium]|nr:AAA family ATPase [Chloroflexota bacterium]
MKIDRIELDGFARLQGLDLAFSSDFNVILGPNEAGKSTLAEAMQALLFGPTDGADSRAPNQFRTRFRPWSGGAFGGTLYVCREGGERYRIFRDFEKGETKLYHDPGATDETARYNPGRHGWIDFAARHLGMTSTVFRACGWIEQGALHHDRSQLTTLKGKLESLADAPGSGASAQDALMTLRDWLRQRVNPDAHATSHSPYLTARATVEALRIELAKSRAALAALDGLVIDERKLLIDVASLKQGIDSLDRLLAQRELVVLEDKCRRLQTIDTRLTEVDARLVGLADVACLSTDTIEAAASALSATKRATSEVVDAAGEVDRERAGSEQVRQELNAVETALDGLPVLQQAAIETADREVREWEQADQTVASAGEQASTLQRQLGEIDTTADPALARLSAGVPVERLDDAIGKAVNVSALVAEAQSEAVAAKVPREVEDEFDTLNQTLGDVALATISELTQREDRLRQAAARSAAASRLAFVVAASAAVIGGSLGFLSLGLPGAAAGVVALGAVGFLAVRLLRYGNDAIPPIAKNRALLRADLARYGVDSAGALRAAWDRRLELVGPVRQIRAARQRIAERQQAFDQRSVDLENLCGTRDLDEARGILGALRQRESRRASLNDQLRSAMGMVRAAESSLSQKRQAAIDVLNKLDHAADTAAEAREVVGAVRASQNRRNTLLQRKAELTGEQRGYAEHEKRLKELQAELGGAQSVLDACLAALGITTPASDPDRALADRRARFEEYQTALIEQASQRRTREYLIGAENKDDWQPRCAVLRRRAAGADPHDNRSREDLEQRQRVMTSERDACQEKIHGLRQHRESALTGLREPAAIEEDLAEAERESTRLERLKGALDDARDLLTTAAEDFRRDFAPRLRSSIEGDLASITAGRYREVEVDPADLTVRVKSAERSDLVSLDHLSHGTCDAVYVLLRATVAQLLSGSGEPVPLFLDDPLVHVDHDRAIRLLDVFAKLGQHWQIFYFTQDDRVVAWANHYPSVKVHPLDVTMPAAASVPDGTTGAGV